MIAAKSLHWPALALAVLLIPFSDLRAQKKMYPRLSLEIGAGYAFFSPDEVNNFLVGLGRKKIANGFALRGGLRVQVSRYIDFNFKIGRMSSATKAEFVVLNNNFEPIATLQDEYRARTLPVSIGVGGRVPFKALRLRGEFNIEHHIARVQYEIPDQAGLQLSEFQTTAKSNGLGFSFAAGPEWRPFAILAFNAKAGYRAAKISDFLSAPPDSQDPFLPLEFELDLSGIFFEAGVQIHP